MVESLLGMFSPLAAMSKELQATLQLDRTPSCRREHGRLEILLRGGGMTEAPRDQQIALARRLTDAARPMLRAHRKRDHRRLADRAIAVAFEDEQVVSDGIATSRFTYLASHDHDSAGTDRTGRRTDSDDSAWSF